MKLLHLAPPLFLCVGVAAAQVPLEVDPLPDGAPLGVTAWAGPTELFVEVDVEDGWHLYARDVGGGQPVGLAVEAGSAFAAAGALETPASADGKLTGRFRLRLPLARGGEGADLAATFSFMACDPLECLEPMEVALWGEVEALDVLLVVEEQGERQERIAGFLADNGFAVTSTTYAAATAADCEAVDVVLADSRLFDAARGSRAAAVGFPETATPVVGVGFLATEMFEAHGLAMTSGYI